MLRCNVCDSINITEPWFFFFYCAECEEECKPIEDGKDAK